MAKKTPAISAEKPSTKRRSRARVSAESTTNPVRVKSSTSISEKTGPSIQAWPGDKHEEQFDNFDDEDFPEELPDPFFD